ncbi:MAG: PqiC family protein [Candidatus Thiodiazotropha sp. (ex Ustalcina ferruginea)]|nr:PqiC family protein [Candidatus Thiodiazotropha sp. (ex Ustalcina ferruginea)]
MMLQKTMTRLMIVAASLTLFVAGCAGPSPPTRFYRLDGQPNVAELIRFKPQAGLTLVGVGPIKLAGYLDRPQIIKRLSSHQLELREFDQWAGSLQENMLQVMSDFLRQKLKTMQVISYPWHGSVRPEYEVLFYISRFDQESDRIWLQVRWSLIESHANKLVEMQQLVIEEAIDGNGVEDGVMAANRAMGQLAKQIADTIQSLAESSQP